MHTHTLTHSHTHTLTHSHTHARMYAHTGFAVVNICSKHFSAYFILQHRQHHSWASHPDRHRL